MVRFAALLVAASLTASGAGATRTTTAIVLNGTATLKAFDVTKACKWDNTTKALRVGCTVYGAYAGLPGPGGAGYGWVWNLPENAIGVTTGYGSERGLLVLNFGKHGALSLSLSGKQKPVGKQTTARAKVVTTGTWTMAKGTSSLAGE